MKPVTVVGTGRPGTQRNATRIADSNRSIFYRFNQQYLADPTRIQKMASIHPRIIHAGRSLQPRFNSIDVIPGLAEKLIKGRVLRQFEIRNAQILTLFCQSGLRDTFFLHTFPEVMARLDVFGRSIQEVELGMAWLESKLDDPLKKWHFQALAEMSSDRFKCQFWPRMKDAGLILSEALLTYHFAKVHRVATREGWI